MTRQAILIQAILLSGLSAPAQDRSHPFHFTTPDEKLLAQANELDKQYEKKGLVLHEPEAEAYLNAIGNRLLGSTSPPERVQYRFHISRGPQLVNRVVDIGDYIDKKVWVNLANVTQGPAGNTGERLRRKLAAQGKRLPLLGNDAETANRQYTKYFALGRDRARGAAHKLEWAEYFHYIGPEVDGWEGYISKNAVPL
jgi:hypothetical protein